MQGPNVHIICSKVQTYESQMCGCGHMSQLDPDAFFYCFCVYKANTGLTICGDCFKNEVWRIKEE